MTHRLLSLALLFTLFACGDEPKFSIAGSFKQELEGDQKGMTIQFDSKTDKMLVHTAPDASGGHGHVEGTYVFDDANNTVTVKGKIAGRTKGDEWTGKLEGDHLTLSSGEDSMHFHRSDAPHDH
ncbi:MAG: hypothetical protein AAF196_11310 [Planctomycetota bacterium]